MFSRCAIRFIDRHTYKIGFAARAAEVLQFFTKACTYTNVLECMRPDGIPVSVVWITHGDPPQFALKSVEIMLERGHLLSIII